MTSLGFEKRGEARRIELAPKLKAGIAIPDHMVLMRMGNDKADQISPHFLTAYPEGGLSPEIGAARPPQSTINRLMSPLRRSRRVSSPDFARPSAVQDELVFHRSLQTPFLDQPGQQHDPKLFRSVGSS
jgi:hypothetical protein